MEAETTRALEAAPLDAGISSQPTAPRLGGRAAGSSAVSLARDYLALTKPRIISLLLVTTVATMLVADPSGPSLAIVLWTMLGGYLAAGGAGAINHYLDREADARMARTPKPATGQRPHRAQPRADLRHRPRGARLRCSWL